MTLTQTIFEFLDVFSAKIEKLSIDVSSYNLDHVAYQASSADDFEFQKKRFEELANFAHEAVIGGRRVAVFKLRLPIQYKHNIVTALEVLEPKNDQKCESHWEHAEYVIAETFEDLMKKYPQIIWDTSSMSRSLYSHLKVKLDDSMQVKFHRIDILQAIQEDV